MAKKVMQKVTFPLWDFLGLFICYRAHFSVLETVETICVAISLRSNHKMTGLYVSAILVNQALVNRIKFAQYSVFAVFFWQWREVMVAVEENCIFGSALEG